MLLSWFVCKDLGILPPSYPHPAPRINSVLGSAPDQDGIGAMKQQLIQEFADVFKSHGQLKPMAGPAMKIELLPNTVPFTVNGVRPIPSAFRTEVTMLDNMERQGIIRTVTEPTDWTHPLVVVPKHNGKLRICVDLTNLNRFVRRPLHPLHAKGRRQWSQQHGKVFQHI